MCILDILYSRISCKPFYVFILRKDYPIKKPSKPAAPTPTPAPTPATPQNSLKFKVGDVVKFAGGKQYSASVSDSGYNANSGVVKITITAAGAKHPYHAVSEDGSGTYGWVDADKLSAISANSNTDKYTPGAKLTLKDVNLYAGAGATRPVRKLSGIYYIYDGKNFNGYYRICPSPKNVNKEPIGQNVTGWIKVTDIS